MGDLKLEGCFRTTTRRLQRRESSDRPRVPLSCGWQRPRLLGASRLRELTEAGSCFVVIPSMR